MENSASPVSGTADVSTAQKVPPWLLALTFAVQYNPNCPSPWLVRLCGFMSGAINFGNTRNPAAKDAVGYGQTFEEAALNAKAIVDADERAFRAECAARAEAQQRAREAWRAERAQPSASNSMRA